MFDLSQAGVVLLGHDHPGDSSHTVAVDPATHHVFFPLEKGRNGTPVMRIMQPSMGHSHEHRAQTGRYGLVVAPLSHAVRSSPRLTTEASSAALPRPQ